MRIEEVFLGQQVRLHWHGEGCPLGEVGTVVRIDRDTGDVGVSFEPGVLESQMTERAKDWAPVHE